MDLLAPTFLCRDFCTPDEGTLSTYLRPFSTPYSDCGAVCRCPAPVVCFESKATDLILWCCWCCVCCCWGCSVVVESFMRGLDIMPRRIISFFWLVNEVSSCDFLKLKC